MWLPSFTLALAGGTCQRQIVLVQMFLRINHFEWFRSLLWENYHSFQDLGVETLDLIFYIEILCSLSVIVVVVIIINHHQSSLSSSLIITIIIVIIVIIMIIIINHFSRRVCYLLKYTSRILGRSRRKVTT